VVGVFAEAVVFGVWSVGARTSSPSLVARTGGLLFFWFNRVALTFELRRGTAPGSRVAGSVAVVFAPLLGTIIVWSLLFLGGRAVARRAPGGPRSAALHGAKLALPYAALCFLASFLTTVRGAAGPSSVQLISSVGPSHGDALVWPLLFGVVFGGIGGLLSHPRTRGGDAALERAAAAGGVGMLVTSLVAAFAGLLLLAAAKPSTTRAYFHTAFDRGAARGAALLGVQALVTPNMATWVMAPAMGGCDAVTVSVTSGRGCFLSYWRFPRGRGALGTLGVGGLGGTGPSGAVGERRAPAAYFLFLLIPLIASLAGGARAARWPTRRRSAPDSPESVARAGSAAVRGACAGVVFAALAAVLFASAGLSARLHGSVAAAGGIIGGRAITATVGPRFGLGVALAAAWGVAGGAAGGVLFRRRPGP